MSENVEKIYCCDRGDDNALTAALLANGGRRDDWGPMAAMMNNNASEWMNNPFAYLMFLALFSNGGFGMGNGGAAGAATQGVEAQAQLNAIRTQLQDGQNAECIKSAIQGNGVAISQLAQTLNMDFNAVQRGCCDVQAAIQQVGGQVGFSSERVINAVNLGDCNIIQALQNCCCQTQRQMADFRADLQLQSCKDTAEIRNGQRDLDVTMAKGFAENNFATQRQTCDIINAGNANTQRIIDTLNNHWNGELSQRNQDLKFEVSQLKQNQYLASLINNGCGGGCCCGGGGLGQ